MNVIDRAIGRLADRAATAERDAALQTEITERLRAARFWALVAWRRAAARKPE